MVLALDPGMFDQVTSIGLQTGHGAANMLVNLDDLFNGGRLEEGRGDTLLDAEDYTFRCRYLIMRSEHGAEYQSNGGSGKGS